MLSCFINYMYNYLFNKISFFQNFARVKVQVTVALSSIVAGNTVCSANECHFIV